MARNRSAVIQRLEQLIEKLKQPVSPEEAKQGWTASKRQRWIPFFTELLQRLKDQRPFDKEDRITHIHIARAMDHDGIDGDLTEEAAAISNALETLE